MRGNVAARERVLGQRVGPMLPVVSGDSIPLEECWRQHGFPSSSGARLPWCVHEVLYAMSLDVLLLSCLAESFRDLPRYQHSYASTAPLGFAHGCQALIITHCFTRRQARERAGVLYELGGGWFVESLTEHRALLREKFKAQHVARQCACCAPPRLLLRAVEQRVCRHRPEWPRVTAHKVCA